MKAHKFSLLFFGSDLFSIRVLEHLLNKKICPIQVVTKYNSLLDQFSSSKQLGRFRWPLEKSDEGQKDSFNIGLVASFGELIDIETIERFHHGLFNVHPSLLPRFRGSTPVQTAILEGAKVSGCTIMRIPPIAKFDIGDIVLQKRVSIKDREYATDLRDRLADVGAIMAERLLLNYEECLVNSRPQSDEGKSYARKIKPEHGLVKFQDESSIAIDRKVRAFTGFIDIYTFCLGGLKIKLESLRDPEEVESYDLSRLHTSLLRGKNVIDETSSVSLPAGTMFFHKNRRILCIKCSDQKWLAFESATPEFKPKMSALEFYNGYLSKLSLRTVITDV